MRQICVTVTVVVKADTEAEARAIVDARLLPWFQDPKLDPLPTPGKIANEYPAGALMYYRTEVSADQPRYRP